MTDAAGTVTTYQYDDDVQSDSFGWLLSVTSAQGTADELTVSYVYDAAGRVVEEHSPGGAVSMYQYDQLDRVTAVIGVVGLRDDGRIKGAGSH